MVLTCLRCRSSDKPGAKFQDSQYGAGKRVHNETGKLAGTRVYRCTVCDHERTAGNEG